MRKDRQTDMMKLRVAFRNFANAPKHPRRLPQLPADVSAETQTGDVPNASKRKPLKRDIQQLTSTTFPEHPAFRLQSYCINPLSPEINPICYLLALLAHDFLHVSRIRFKSLTFRLLMSYIYLWSTYS
jgi:hypothetical protein